MLEYAIATAIMLLAYFVYSWVIRPRRLMAHYATMYRKQGYKVMQLPHQIMGASFLDKMFKAESEKGDPFYHYKHSYPGTDVVVANLLNIPYVILMNPNLIQ
jgi:hypothetical protein